MSASNPGVTPGTLPSVASEGFSLGSRPEPVGVLLHRLWRSRELIAVLSRREFYVRFKRAGLGVLWAVAVPALQAAVMVLVFSRIIPVHAGPHFVTFVFAGMTAWSFFAAAFAIASTSIVDGMSLASRIYFPRAVLPLASVGASLYGLTVGSAILVVVDAVDTRHVGLEILLLVPAALLVVLLVCGLGLLVSAMHVFLRDMRFLVQASLLVWLYVTPVFYPLSSASGALRALIVANPLTGVVEVFRAATVGADADSGVAIVVAVMWSIVLVMAGVLLQARLDRRFTDLL